MTAWLPAFFVSIIHALVHGFFVHFIGYCGFRNKAPLLRMQNYTGYILVSPK